MPVKRPSIHEVLLQFVACMVAVLLLDCSDRIARGLLPSGLYGNTLGALALVLFGLHDKSVGEPRRVVLSHMIGATVGVILRYLVQPWSPMLAVATAVSVTLALLMYFDLLHPPAGAIALWALAPAPQFDPAIFIVFNATAGAAIFLVWSRVALWLLGRAKDKPGQNNLHENPEE